MNKNDDWLRVVSLCLWSLRSVILRVNQEYDVPYNGTSHTSPETRNDVEKLILNDVQFLFRNSNYWFAFINIPLFFTTFCNSSEREGMQPALVLAILMMSNFLRSSEAEMGGEGRTRTLWLREKAQAALEASVNAGWIDAGLAQAAWVCLRKFCASLRGRNH